MLLWLEERLQVPVQLAGSGHVTYEPLDGGWTLLAHDAQLPRRVCLPSMDANDSFGKAITWGNAVALGVSSIGCKSVGGEKLE